MYTAVSKARHEISRQVIAHRIGKGAACTALVLCLFYNSTAHCASVSLAWDPSPSPDVIGYNVWYGPATHNYTNVVDVGNSTTFTLFGLVVGSTYWIAITAYNNLGVQSDPSDEVVYTVPEATYPPKFESGSSLRMNNGTFNFELGADPGQEVIIQASTDLVHWVSISTNTVSGTTLAFTDPGATNLIRVFRALLNTGGTSQPVGIVLELPKPPLLK